MKIELSWAAPVASARKFQIFEVPAQRKPERIVEFRRPSIAPAARQLFELSNQPLQVLLSPSGRVEPPAPWNVGFHIGVFFQQRNEAWKCRTHSALIFIFIPGNFHAARDAPGKPASGFKIERVLHRCTRNAG